MLYVQNCLVCDVFSVECFFSLLKGNVIQVNTHGHAAMQICIVCVYVHVFFKSDNGDPTSRSLHLESLSCGSHTWVVACTPQADVFVTLQFTDTSFWFIFRIFP